MPATTHRLSEPDPIETRLQVVIELLNKAATEVDRVVSEINRQRLIAPPTEKDDPS